MLTLSEGERNCGIYAASTGNHGAAVAYACQKLDVPCIIYVPENSSQAKLANMKSFDAEIRVHGRFLPSENDTSMIGHRRLRMTHL